MAAAGIPELVEVEMVLPLVDFAVAVAVVFAAVVVVDSVVVVVVVVVAAAAVIVENISSSEFCCHTNCQLIFPHANPLLCNAPDSTQSAEIKTGFI